jgi:hypothetical protein
MELWIIVVFSSAFYLSYTTLELIKPFPAASPEYINLNENYRLQKQLFIAWQSTA